MSFSMPDVFYDCSEALRERCVGPTGRAIAQNHTVGLRKSSKVELFFILPAEGRVKATERGENEFE